MCDAKAPNFSHIHSSDLASMIEALNGELSNFGDWNEDCDGITVFYERWCIESRYDLDSITLTFEGYAGIEVSKDTELYVLFSEEYNRWSQKVREDFLRLVTPSSKSSESFKSLGTLIMEKFGE